MHWAKHLITISPELTACAVALASQRYNFMPPDEGHAKGGSGGVIHLRAQCTEYIVYGANSGS
jgi:hypothetical protein